MIVLDSSAALELVTGSSARAAAELSQRVRADGELHAPHLIDLEVASVLRRWVRGNTVDADVAETLLARFRELAIARYPHAPFVGRIWAMRGSVTAHDAAYVTLAEALAAPLLTCDAHLARSRGHAARIELIGRSG